MEKINFQNGVTKVNADTFNTFQNNINDAISLMKIETLKAENPIGHIRFETTNINPSTYLGFGTWVLWGSGKVPVGVDASDTDFSTVEKTGAEKTHTLTTNEIPKHKHEIAVSNNSATGLYETKATNATGDVGRAYTQEAGGGQAHNNMPPYITCYMWKRTA